MTGEKLLFKGYLVKPGDFVIATNANSGAVTFYRVERVWGQHGTFRVVTEQEAGPNAIAISVQPEARRA
jgi:hypothetical protein